MRQEILKLEIFSETEDGSLILEKDEDCEYDCCRIEVKDDFILHTNNLKEFIKIITEFMK
jgi:hypothetical protein